MCVGWGGGGGLWTVLTEKGHQAVCWEAGKVLCPDVSTHGKVHHAGYLGFLPLGYIYIWIPMLAIYMYGSQFKIKKK